MERNFGQGHGMTGHGWVVSHCQGAGLDEIPGTDSLLWNKMIFRVSSSTNHSVILWIQLRGKGGVTKHWSLEMCNKVLNPYCTLCAQSQRQGQTKPYCRCWGKSHQLHFGRLEVNIRRSLGIECSSAALASSPCLEDTKTCWAQPCWEDVVAVVLHGASLEPGDQRRLLHFTQPALQWPFIDYTHTYG